MSISHLDHPAEGELEDYKEENGEEVFVDYETGERLLAPFFLIALPGSNKRAVPVNVFTLEKTLLIDSLILPFDASYFGAISKGELMYALLMADADYSMQIPNLIRSNFRMSDLKGYFHPCSIQEHLPNTFKYFNPEEDKNEKTPESSPEDDFPF